MSPQPRFSDTDLDLFLNKLARGKCSAVMRNLGPDKNWARCWRPTVAGELVGNGDDPDDGFPLRADAVAAARRYRESCRETLAQANGDL